MSIYLTELYMHSLLLLLLLLSACASAQSSSVAQYSGVVDVFTSLYRENGLSGLYVGSLARVTWLLPFTTIYLGVYEFTKRALLKRKIDLYVKDVQTKAALKNKK
jgi:hypothetical protein